MSVTVTHPTVGTTAVKIAENAIGAKPGQGEDFALGFLVKNLMGTAPVFLGGSNAVTASGGGRGFRWDVADGPLTVELEPGEQLWAVVASTPQDLDVLRVGR